MRTTRQIAIGKPAYARRTDSSEACARRPSCIHLTDPSISAADRGPRHSVSGTSPTFGTAMIGRSAGDIVETDWPPTVPCATVSVRLRATGTDDVRLGGGDHRNRP